MKAFQNFWVSYSDLFTTLFFVMMALFLVTVITLKHSLVQSRIEAERLRSILQLEEQFAPLINNPMFHYIPECQKFVARDLMGIEIFEPNRTEIKAEFHDEILAVGRHLIVFLEKLSQNQAQFAYILVIEGNMANDYRQSIDPYESYGFSLSYERALAVHDFWLQNGINFRGNPKVEVLIAGSGFAGLCRDPIEENNKRFSIQLIPKISKPFQ